MKKSRLGLAVVVSIGVILGGILVEFLFNLESNPDLIFGEVVGVWTYYCIERYL